jgi:hypothetical protein
VLLFYKKDEQIGKAVPATLCEKQDFVEQLEDFVPRLFPREEIKKKIRSQPRHVGERNKPELMGFFSLYLVQDCDDRDTALRQELERP